MRFSIPNKQVAEQVGQVAGIIYQLAAVSVFQSEISYIANPASILQMIKRNYNRITIFLFLVAFPIAAHPLNGQENSNYPYHDSVCSQLDDHDRFVYLVELYKEYYKTDRELILYFANKIEPLALAYGTEPQIADVFKMIGAAYYNIGKARETKHYINKALETYRTLGDTIWELTMWVYLGAAENMAGNYTKALESYIKAFELESYYFDSLDIHTRSTTDFNTRGDILNGIGNVNIRLGNYEKSREYYLLAREVFMMVKDTVDMANVHNNLGNTFLWQGEYDRAMEYYLDGLKYTGEHAFDKQRALLYSNVGNVYWYKEDYKQALTWMLRHMELNRQLGDVAALSSACNNVGGLYIYLGDYDRAEPFLLEGLSLARMANLRISVQQNLLALSDLAAARNDASTALDYYKQYVAVKDSILNDRVTLQITEMQTKYDTERITNELKYESLKVKNRERLIYSIVLIAFFIMIVSVLLFNRYKLKQRNQKNELEKQNLDIGQRLLRSQVNPHFIFNSLNSIKGYMLSKKGEKASLYIDKFAALMRLILINSRESFIPLSDDIKTLELNLELEKLRFSGKFDFRIKTDPEIDPDRIYIPPMLAQPYLENSILHGLANKKGKGNITILFKMKEVKLRCTIEDDGIGREAALKFRTKRKKKSIGMQLTHERLELMKKELGLDISVKITDLKDNAGQATGTRVELLIPFEEE